MASYVPNFTLENKIGTSIHFQIESIQRQRLIVEQLSYLKSMFFHFVIVYRVKVGCIRRLPVQGTQT
jgi:hypothetical protein